MTRFILSVLITAPLLAAELTAQQAAPPPPTIKQLGLYVYPAKGQSKEQQSKDEQACYQWAQQESGINLATGQVNTEAAGKAAAEKTNEAATGAAVGGAARGAAGGAAIGAIAGDAGTGAAIGAVAGAVAGRRAKKQAVAQAEKQGQAQAAAYNQQQVESFKKALGVCLEGRGYTVK